MMNRKKFFLGLVGGLVVTAAARADMMRAFKPEAERQEALDICAPTDLQYSDVFIPHNCPTIADLRLWSVEFLSAAGAGVRHTSEIEHPIDVTNGPGSFHLCLYALMSLSLCSVPHCLKRSCLGHIPEWYHDGGPCQIGHSFAVLPKILCPVPVYCLIQPDDMVERLIPQYRLRTVVSLWRKSQFTSVVLATRGPPSMA